MAVNVEFPVNIVSDLHVGHPASYIRDPEQLAPLFVDAKTVIFNGDSVEMLWMYNRERAHDQLGEIAEVCLKQGARPVFLNGNHDPMVSSASHLDLCNGALLVTHGDILFHDVAPWSKDAPIIASEHERVLDELDFDALTDLEDRLHAIKRASLALEMYDPRRPTGRLAGLALALREGWPPWRALQIVRFWMLTPGLAATLAAAYRPDARFVLVGHTHFAGVWNRGPRVVINTGSFLPFSGRLAVKLYPERMEVYSLRCQQGTWHFGRMVRDFKISCLQGAHPG